MNVVIENVTTVDLVNCKKGTSGKKVCSVRFGNSDGVSVTVVFNEDSIEAVRKAKEALGVAEDFLAGEI